MNAAYVIVGASLAGAKAVEALRGEGCDGPLTLIGDETSCRISGRRCPRTTCWAGPNGKRSTFTRRRFLED
jgi:hypothetical protein